MSFYAGLHNDALRSANDCETLDKLISIFFCCVFVLPLSCDGTFDGVRLTHTAALYPSTTSTEIVSHLILSFLLYTNGCFFHMLFACICAIDIQSDEHSPPVSPFRNWKISFRLHRRFFSGSRRGMILV